MEQNQAIVLFKEQKIRRTWHQGEWWFSVVDVVNALTDSKNARRYWSDLKGKISEEEGYIELYEKIVQLKLPAPDGKMRATDCANTESLLRIIQSIPSPKAEPFKRWLAKVGMERIQEIENPELAQERIKRLYEEKGYPKDWIDKRLRGMAVRQDLTDEWKQRGLTNKKDYAILTANYLIADCSRINGSGQVLLHEKAIKEWWRDNKSKLIDFWDKSRPSDCTVGVYRGAV
jgi:prophage antirepressor-like protein